MINKIKTSLKLSTLILTFFIIHPKAHALDISLFAPITYSNYHVAEGTASTSSSNRLGVGAGVTLGLGVFPFLSLETGLLNITHAFVNSVYVSSSNLTIDKSYSFNYWQVPLLLRFSPIDSLSAQIGGYFSKNNTTSATSSRPDTLQITAPSKADDYGLMAGIGYRKSFSPLAKLRVDLMYEYGLKKLDTIPDTKLSTRSINLWVGIMLDLI
ncbi:PorT family protein [bacterium]|jgi:hypothetical protein|nr:PorT family protein [bacterium]